MNLRGIPREALLAAAEFPGNEHAAPLLRRAAGEGIGKGAPQRRKPAEAKQERREGLSGLSFTMPLPPKELSPNARVHWAKKFRAVREYRSLAKFHAGIAGALCRGLPWERAEVSLTFYFPHKRVRDGDNAIASMKAAFDGMSDAGVIANDSGLTHLPPTLLVDRDNPRVEITLTLAQVEK